MLFQDIDGGHLNVREMFFVVFGVVAGRIEAERSEPHGYSGGACLPFFAVLTFGPLRDIYRVGACLGLKVHMFPQLHDPLLCISGVAVDGSIRVGAYENRRVYLVAELEEVVQIGFPIADGDDLGIAHHLLGVCQRFKPPVAFLLLDRQIVMRFSALASGRLL